MMSERQAAFRREYRSRIAGWYNGYVHILVIYAIGAMALYIYASHIAGVAWWEWQIVPAVFLACNIFEWFLHKYVMHRPINVRGLKAIYERHTLNHHSSLPTARCASATSGTGASPSSRPTRW